MKYANIFIQYYQFIYYLNWKKTFLIKYRQNKFYLYTFSDHGFGSVVCLEYKTYFWSSILTDYVVPGWRLSDLQKPYFVSFWSFSFVGLLTPSLPLLTPLTTFLWKTTCLWHCWPTIIRRLTSSYTLYRTRKYFPLLKKIYRRLCEPNLNSDKLAFR